MALDIGRAPNSGRLIHLERSHSKFGGTESRPTPRRAASRTDSLLRWSGIAAAVILVVIAAIRPSLGLRLFWGLYVPLLPLVFLAVPGFWRNICPMAAVGQLPARFSFSRGLRLPASVQRKAPFISAGLFLLVVPLRHLLLDQSGIALAVFLLICLALSFVGGVLFSGKSGWCSQFCPMLQVERLYGQSPLRVVQNSHCRPCVGCTSNCYDLRPATATLADLYRDSGHSGRPRAWFAGAMPWLIVAFFTQADLASPTLVSIATLYGRTLLFVSLGIVLYSAISKLAALSPHQLLLGHAVVAFNLYYFFVAKLTLAQAGVHSALPVLAIQGGVIGLSMVWLRRALPLEQAQLDQSPAVVPAPRQARAKMTEKVG